MAEQWFTVASARGAASEVVEIDLDTVRVQGGNGDGVIRVSFDVPQSHPRGFAYLSLIATAHFDCARQNFSLNSAAYFALPGGRGAREGADSSGSAGGMPPKLIESIPAAARKTLLKATCATASAN